MTLAELQALIMARAVADLDRLKATQVKERAAAAESTAEPRKELGRLSQIHTPEASKAYIRDEQLQAEIDDQDLLIAKLTYNHEREQAELERDEYMRNLERARLVADIDEKAQLIEYRQAILEEFRRGNEIQIKGHDIQKAGLAAIAEAIQGRAPL